MSNIDRLRAILSQRCIVIAAPDHARLLLRIAERREREERVAAMRRKQRRERVGACCMLAVFLVLALFLGVS